VLCQKQFLFQYFVSSSCIALVASRRPCELASCCCGYYLLYTNAESFPLYFLVAVLQAAMGGGFHEHGLGFQLTTDDERGRGHGGGATAAPWWATAAPQGQGCAAAKFPVISSGEWKL
jgi:hypothetical protein